MYAKYQNVSVKTVVQVDFLAYALSRHHLELQRAITLTKLAPNPLFSIIKVHLIDINVPAKFDEFPSLPFQDIKEKLNCHRQMNKQMERTEKVKNSIPPSNTVCRGYKDNYFWCLNC